MPSLRDYASDVRRYYLPKAATRARDAWHQAVGKRVQGARQQNRNWMNGRARQRGKAPLPDRVSRAVGSRTPVVRNRINPATGRPRRTDRSPQRTRQPRANRAARSR